MARVDSAIAGVQERDKWRRRLEALERSLADLSDRRHRLEQRMQRVHKELAKLEVMAREFVDLHGRFARAEVKLGPRGPFL